MSQKTRVSTLYGPKDLRLEYRALEPPGPEELQIAIRATGLCGSDLHYYQDFRNGDIQIQEPLTLGHESAGVVVNVGPQVDDFNVGDRVALEVGLPCGGCGSCIEDSISFESGALLEPMGVAIQALRRGQITSGTSVLVLGAGTIGLLCAALSKVAKAGQVTIADNQQQRIDFAMEHAFTDHGLLVSSKGGTDVEANLKTAKGTAALACQTLKKQALRVNQFDVVFECTGAEVCTQAAIYAARPGGKVVIVGMGNPVQTVPLSAAAHREVDIVGSFRYANTFPDAIMTIVGANPLPDIETLITQRYHGLENVEKAFSMAARTEDDDGAIVLKVIVLLGDEETNMKS